MALPSNLTGAGLGLLAFTGYSLYDAGAKLLGASFHPLQVIAAAGLVTMPLLLAYALLDRGTGSLRPVRPGLMALRAVSTVVNYITAVTAFVLLPLAEAYVILFTMPLFISVLAVPVLGERFDPVRGLAVLAGLAGVVIALDPTATALGLGHAMALAGSLTGALNYIVIRKTGAVERTAVMLVWPQLAVFLAAAAATPFVWRPMPAADLGIAAGMAAAGILGLAAIIAAYRRAPAIVIAPMQYSQIVWGAVFGALIFGESPGLRTLLGALVIAAAGLVIVARQERALAAPSAG